MYDLRNHLQPWICRGCDMSVGNFLLRENNAGMLEEELDEANKARNEEDEEQEDND